MNSWILAARPKTLIAALIPIVVGTCLAVLHGGKFDIPIVISAFFFALLIQIACNYFNDAIDYQKGGDTTLRLGPLRVVQSGRLKARHVMWAATLILGLGFLIALPMIAKGGLPLLIIVLLSMFFAFAYTGGPFPIAYLGLGEVFVLPFFGVVPVAVLQYLLGGHGGKEAILAGWQIGCFAALLLSINNVRDIEEDKKAGKKTLAVRFGERFSKREAAFFAFLPYILGVFWIFFGKIILFFLPLLSLPLSISLIRNIRNSRPSVLYNAFLGKAALLTFVFGSLLTIGAIIKMVFY